MGSLEENHESLKANGEEKKWGEGVNSEYESYRTDSDGDGLSDKWELLNDRDPQDGRLIFDFNNGGWQTEGWFSKDIKSNIAGFLGTLDFKLDSKKGRLLRRNLKYDTTAKDESIQIRLKSDTLQLVFFGLHSFLNPNAQGPFLISRYIWLVLENHF